MGDLLSISRVFDKNLTVPDIERKTIAIAHPTVIRTPKTGVSWNPSILVRALSLVSNNWSLFWV